MLVEHERWPPVYDDNDLAETIKLLATYECFEKVFYEGGRKEVPFCQGDVITLPVQDAGIPYLNDDGQPAADDAPPYWLIVGNTCDLSREAWTQLLPIYGFDDLSDVELDALRRYKYSRRFYLPAWKLEGVRFRYLIADFMRPVAIKKNGLANFSNVEARLSRYGWLLLHACLVRFLARDDGRCDR